MSSTAPNSITAILLLKDENIFDCDSASLEMFGCERDQLLASDFFRKFSCLVQPDGGKALKLSHRYLKMALSDEPQYFPWRFQKSTGSFFDAEISLKKKILQGQTYLQVVIIDISEKKRTNEALLVQKSYFQQLFENSPEAIVIANKQTQILNVNSSFETIFQYSYQEALGSKLPDLVVPLEKREEYWNANSHVRKGEKALGESVRRRKDGSLIQVAYASFPVVLNSESVGYYVIYSDITSRKVAEEKLKYISFHDPLTGLYNRAYFEQQMQELQDNLPPDLGMVVCDIDGLKIINDTLGHTAGDELLINTGKILSLSLEGEAVLTRVGGDEFVFLLPCYRKTDVLTIVEKIRGSIDYYNSVPRQIPLNVSLGYSVIEDNFTQDINQLFIEADNNMYRDKLHRGKSARSAIVQTLMTALEARDFITEGHVGRIQILVRKMAEALNLPENTINDLQLLGQFHDIGKVGIPDDILFKPGPLTLEERKIIQRHSEIGARIAQSAPDLAPISDWILKHHEWWDGNGYPFGLQGKDIPLECRILAIADTYDSMTSDRPYRKALPHEVAIAEIQRCAGTQFDPTVVKKCLQVLQRMPLNRSINF